MYYSERLPPKLCIGQSTYCDLELQILKASPVNHEILQWKHPKLSPSWSRRLSSCFNHIIKLLLSEVLVRFRQGTILPKETEPTPKADRNRPLRLDPTQIRYFPDIDLISFDDWTMPFTGSNCPVQLSTTSPTSWRYPFQPEVCLCKPQEALLLTWQSFQGCQSKQPPRYLCINLDQSRL